MTDPCHAAASVTFERSRQDNFTIVRISVGILRIIFYCPQSPILYPRVRHTTLCRFHDDQFFHLNGPEMDELPLDISIIELQQDLA